MGRNFETLDPFFTPSLRVAWTSTRVSYDVLYEELGLAVISWRCSTFEKNGTVLVVPSEWNPLSTQTNGTVPRQLVIVTLRGFSDSRNQ